MSKMRKTNSAKAKNIVKRYLRKKRNAFAFKDIIANQKSADSWIVEGVYTNPSLGSFYFIAYVDDGNVSFCPVYPLPHM